MVNKEGLIICDETKIVLNDGVTIFPGYVEVKDGFLIRYDTNDPNNELALVKPWTLHNRVPYMFEALREPMANEKVQGKHFMSKKALEKYLSRCYSEA